MFVCKKHKKVTVEKQFIDTPAQLKFSEMVSHSYLPGIKGSLNEMGDLFNYNLVNILNIVAPLKVNHHLRSQALFVNSIYTRIKYALLTLL